MARFESKLFHWDRISDFGIPVEALGVPRETARAGNCKNCG
jgi:hypothetical protein